MACSPHVIVFPCFVGVQKSAQMDHVAWFGAIKGAGPCTQQWGDFERKEGAIKWLMDHTQDQMWSI